MSQPKKVRNDFIANKRSQGFSPSEVQVLMKREGWPKISIQAIEVIYKRAIKRKKVK